jgi:uncharacterized protein YaeQ
VALSSTVFVFDIDLADSDRSVYESLSLRVARHPSESDEFLVARVLAYCLEYREGIAFSRGGLSDTDDPPISIVDLTGVMQAWIDIGTPAADRLHRASKAAPRVVVYTHKDARQWLASLAEAKIYRADAIELHALDRTLIDQLVTGLDRRMSFALSVSGGEVYISIEDRNLHGQLRRLRLQNPEP